MKQETSLMSSDLKIPDSEKPEEVVSEEVTSEDSVKEVTRKHPELEDTYLGGDYSSATIKTFGPTPNQSVSYSKKENILIPIPSREARTKRKRKSSRSNC